MKSAPLLLFAAFSSVSSFALAQLPCEDTIVDLDTLPSSIFGHALDLSGNVLAVSARDDSVSSDLDSSVSILRWTQGFGWLREARLEPLTTNVHDGYGVDVGASGDLVVIGAPGDSNFGVMEKGAVYVYRHELFEWELEQILHLPTGQQADGFGRSVAVEGSTIVVGSPGREQGPVANAGGVYVYEFDGASWSLQQELSFDLDAQLFFGTQVDISGDAICVSAPYADVGSHTDAGEISVYRRSGPTWILEDKFRALSANDNHRVGTELAIHGDVLVAAADIPAMASRRGYATVFRFDGTQWNEEQTLRNSDVPFDYNDEFGAAVAVHGEEIFIGAPNTDLQNFTVRGVALLYQFRDNQWVRAAQLKHPSPDIVSEYGISCALNSERLVVASENTFLGTVHTMEAADIRGEQYTSLCSGTGISGCAECPCGNVPDAGESGGCINSSGGSGQLIAFGCSSPGGLPGYSLDLRFSAEGLPPESFSTLVSGSMTAPRNPTNPCFGFPSGILSPSLDGFRCVVGDLRRHGGRVADFRGRIGDLTTPWGGEGAPPLGILTAAGFAAGQTRHFQATYRDDQTLSCMRGLNTTQAIRVIASAF